MSSELVELKELENEKEIARRLHSSRSSGDYFFVSSRDEENRRWGLNNAPYEPLFKVYTKRYYRIEIIPALQRALTIAEAGGLKFPVPASRYSEIAEFVDGFAEPMGLYIGFCRVDKEDIYNALHRFTEIIIFDREKSREDWRERRGLLNFLSTEVEWENRTLERQGNLSVLRGTFKSGSLARQKLEEKSCEVTLFNHNIRFDEPVHIVRCDREIIAVANAEKYVDIEIQSYDHDRSWIYAEEGTVLKFSHPIPGMGGD